MEGYKKEAKAIIDRLGGYREKAILKDCTFKRGEWNNDHKIVELIANHTEDGHRDGCAVDLVTKKITG